MTKTTTSNTAHFPRAEDLLTPAQKIDADPLLTAALDDVAQLMSDTIKAGHTHFTGLIDTDHIDAAGWSTLAQFLDSTGYKVAIRIDIETKKPNALYVGWGPDDQAPIHDECSGCQDAEADEINKIEADEADETDKNNCDGNCDTCPIALFMHLLGFEPCDASDEGKQDNDDDDLIGGLSKSGYLK